MISKEALAAAKVAYDIAAQYIIQMKDYLDEHSFQMLYVNR